jgi:hypothetical protein
VSIEDFSQDVMSAGGKLSLRQFGLQSHRIKVCVQVEEHVHYLAEVTYTPEVVPQILGVKVHEDVSEEPHDLRKILKNKIMGGLNESYCWVIDDLVPFEQPFSCGFEDMLIELGLGSLGVRPGVQKGPNLIAMSFKNHVEFFEFLGRSLSYLLLNLFGDIPH